MVKPYTKKKSVSLIEEWLSKADSDLQFAEAGFKEHESFYCQICVLSHDSAEKFFKAYLISKEQSPPHIHDLVVLFKSCQKESLKISKWKREIKGLNILNNYYIPLKYPSHYPELNREQAGFALDVAKAVRELVFSTIWGK